MVGNTAVFTHPPQLLRTEASQSAPPRPVDATRKPVVGLVDGNPRHGAEIADALAQFYNVQQYVDGREAVRAMAALRPAVIIIDEDAPPGNGREVLGMIRMIPALVAVPIICKMEDAESGFAADTRKTEHNTVLKKPFKRSQLLAAISTHINKSVEEAWVGIEPVQQVALKNTVSAFNRLAELIELGEPIPYGEMKKSCEPLTRAVSEGNYKDILKGVRGHDNYSYVHSLRVATLLSLFGHTIGIKGDDLMTLSTGGLLHDVGKMDIPNEVLNKPGKLSDEEFVVMKSHVTHTSEHLRESPDIPKGAATIAEQHHEKIDGTGYPRGLKGAELNDLARMSAIVDIFSALTDRRVYKPPMPPEKAMEIMTGMKDGLDQQLLALFRGMLLDAAEGTWDV